MKVRASHEVENKKVEMPGASGCNVRWLIGESDGAPNFAMREFEVGVGGFTPRHSHPYEHEIYVLAGQGVVLEDSREIPLRPGDVILVRPDEIHQFRNTGETALRFLCLIPNNAVNMPVTQAPECGGVAGC
jgi:quercetin dioxygenase-like cupin family protein